MLRRRRKMAPSWHCSSSSSLEVAKNQSNDTPPGLQLLPLYRCMHTHSHALRTPTVLQCTFQSLASVCSSSNARKLFTGGNNCDKRLKIAWPGGKDGMHFVERYGEKKGNEPVKKIVCEALLTHTCTQRKISPFYWQKQSKALSLLKASPPTNVWVQGWCSINKVGLFLTADH